MTIAELIAALAELEMPDAQIDVDVSCPASLVPDRVERTISGIGYVLNIPDGPNAGQWVTLDTEDDS